jgi:predicted Rdx family selenoprotein
MRAVAKETIFERTPWVVVRPQKDSYLFYNSRTDEMHLIPSTGHAIYRLCDGIRTVDEIDAHVSGGFDAEPSVLRERLSDFLSALESRGLVERADD